MSKTLHIQVTQEDIDNGVRGTNNQCPIALAVRRQTGKPIVRVMDRYITLADEADVYENSIDLHMELYTLPWEAQDFIRVFDSNGTEVEDFFGTVRPFDFIATQQEENPTP